MAKQAEQTATREKDFYEILHLHPKADATMVDQAYWHLARLHSASIGEDYSKRTELDILNEAYGVIRSPVLRAQYDQQRKSLPDAGALSLPPKPAPEPEDSNGQDSSPRRGGEIWRRISRLSFNMQQLSAPIRESVVSAVVMLALAGAALIAGGGPITVVVILIFGLAVITVRLANNQRRQSGLPTLHLPAMRVPRLPERSTYPGADPETLRWSTRAMLERWREATEGVAAPQSPGRPPHHDPAVASPHD